MRYKAGDVVIYKDTVFTILNAYAVFYDIEHNGTGIKEIFVDARVVDNYYTKITKLHRILA